jgi:hypothetical protein
MIYYVLKKGNPKTRLILSPAPDDPKPPPVPGGTATSQVRIDIAFPISSPQLSKPDETGIILAEFAYGPHKRRDASCTAQAVRLAMRNYTLTLFGSRTGISWRLKQT